MNQRTIHIIAHTHWDREWYLSFQSYRIKLVDALDLLLKTMETNPDFSYFLLDGQMAVIDDYLEVRPENKERILRLAASKRLGLGPWYILMDEFLCSGETIVRNLQLGNLKAALFGGASQIGYLPDMFGHIQQMPQILNLAGIDKAVVWRGVPRAVDYHRFWWASPDGSKVLTEYLYNGYSTGAGIIDDEGHFVNLVKNEIRQAKNFFDQDEDFLILNGTDHLPPREFLPDLIKRANTSQEELNFKISSWDEYFLSKKTNAEIPQFTGELRSSARANLLMGVASNHLDVKKLANEAEIKLERFAEPLLAFSLPFVNYRAFLELAWKNLILNSAHDSICACSIDEVVQEVITRYHNSIDITKGLIAKALVGLSNNFRSEGSYVINLSSRKRDLLVQGVFKDIDNVTVQNIETGDDSAVESGALVLNAKDVKAILSQINSTSFDEKTHVNSVAIEAGDPIKITILTSSEPNEYFSLEQTKLELHKVLDQFPESKVEVKFRSLSKGAVLGYVEEVPGFGWKKVEFNEPKKHIGLKQFSDGKIEIKNGASEIIIEPNTGTFEINGYPGFNQLIDEGDDGDTYNYSPPSNDKVITDPIKASANVLEKGPLRARVEIERIYLWPERLDLKKSERAGSQEVRVKSLIEICCNEDLIRVRTKFKNTCSDHRLRVIFPLLEPADYSEAGCAFSTVRRGIIAEKGDFERGLASYPSRHFVRAGGITFIHSGLPEYELIGLIDSGGSTKATKLAVTLLRATGMLSKMNTTYRPFAAGPAIKAVSAQMHADIEANYAISISDKSPYDLVDQFLINPIVVNSISTGGSLDNQGSFIQIEGAEVSCVRALHTNLLEVRIFNPFSESVEAKVNRKGWVVNLAGRLVQEFNGSILLGPFKIVTLWLTDHSGK